MKTVLMVFTKIPRKGVVKTRLTQAQGGILTKKEAKDLYEAMVLDVIEACQTLGERELWLCHDRDGEREYLEKMLQGLAQPEKLAGIFADEGGHFNDCMQYATDYILRRGADDRRADALIIVGGDLPTFQPHMLEEAIQKLERLSRSEAGLKAALPGVKALDGGALGAAIVEGACQEGGFSLIGYTAATPFTYDSVFYNLDGVTALDMLVERAKKTEIPFSVVEMMPDMDIPLDLASAITNVRALELAARYDPAVLAPKRVVAYLDETGLQAVALPPESRN
ncbi:MAG: DUF2064 domain-containing protein [Gracilibacteraceae bacterium]|jgi:glycosyltransferase A (GT-A) superfamily protein (DUF2064 family)|nr:DUF2064 domain-containing protein [Gracilibacteraceae bacterium]